MVIILTVFGTQCLPCETHIPLTFQQIKNVRLEARDHWWVVSKHIIHYYDDYEYLTDLYFGGSINIQK